MSILERIRKVINWLVFTGFAKDDTEIAEKLNYVKSYISQVLNGKKPVSDKFIRNLLRTTFVIQEGVF